MSINEQDHISTHDEALPPTVCDVPQLSRMACSFCRVRKLKCNRNMPTCSSCSRYRHQCVYESTRKVSGSRSRKKGYVSALQERLAQIETSLLKQESRDQNELVQTGPETCVSMGSDLEPDMISPDIVRELEEVYFQKMHDSMPMFHRARYLAATELELGLQPPIYLRHAVLALGACASSKYAGLQERFYRSSREALEFVEMNDHHLDMVSVEQAQTWILIATYEFRRMHFHRSWMSTGRAVRLVQMMGLHCMDGKDSDSWRLPLPKPKDWTAKEERRRTFWMAFCLDRYASIGHGWPMTVDDKDIFTRLPAADEAFQSCTETTSPFLQEAMTPEGAATLSPFAGLVSMTGLCSQRLTNIRRSDSISSDQRNFWISGTLDSSLTRPFIIPSHLRVPSRKWEPNLYFLNMVAHASTIGVHQQALARTDIDSLHPDILRDSERVRVESAIEIASIMRASCHVDLSAINPFTSFCLYVAATALARTDSIELDEHQKNSLQFLLTAMNYIEEVNPLTTAFKRDLETEFPDLTARFSSLNVEGGVENAESFPDCIKHIHGRDPLKGRAPMAFGERATADSRELGLGFASADSLLNQEWLELPQEAVHFEGVADVDFNTMDPFLRIPGDESLGDMFRYPGGSGSGRPIFQNSHPILSLIPNEGLRKENSNDKERPQASNTS